MKRKALITLILGTTLAVAPAARAVVMSDDGGSSSPIVLHADVLGGDGTSGLTTRDEALNQRYGNAVTRLSPQEFKALYQAGGDRLTPQELAALVARGEALNSGYGNGSSVTFQPDNATGGNSIAWNAAIGAAALIGAMLLVLAFAVANRRRHQLSF